MLTQEYLKEVLDYDPEKGVFTWCTRQREHFATDRACNMWNSRFSLKNAGSIDAHGYLMIRISPQLHSAHRLAWLWMTGEWPKDGIDHIDCDRANNRWSNLRGATHAENNRNRRANKNNNSGFKGVSWKPLMGKWQAKIGVNYKTIHIGYYDDRECAASAYERAAKQYHGKFARAA